MRQVFGMKRVVVALVGLVPVSSVGLADPIAYEKLPAAVAKTFEAAFPNATIEKLTEEPENGVMVYDFEFRMGDRQKETDIAADGTMMESTLVVVAADIPGPAMKAMLKAARGAKLGRLEWIESRYEPEGGKVVLLPAPVIKYAAEMTRKNQTAEVIVTATGSVVESPIWVAATPAPAPARTGK